jgi:hypothetical protein
VLIVTIILVDLIGKMNTTAKLPVMLHLRENFYGKDLRADVSSYVEPRWTQSPEEKGK